ncbi:MAG: hypothetical protein GC134_04245 [Proteobacteria bacterium]|nr:hypothetical protein [Pseudomonadota bacterium]
MGPHLGLVAAFLSILFFGPFSQGYAVECSPIPQQPAQLGLSGYQVWHGGQTQVFNPVSGTAYKIPIGSIALGAAVHDGCAIYPDGQGGVVVSAATNSSRTLDLGTPFPVQLVMPANLDAAAQADVATRVQTLFDKIRTLYPLGFAADDRRSYTLWLSAGMAGSGEQAADLLHPQEGTMLGVIALPPDHPRFQREAVQAIVNLFTRRPHPQMGPLQRKGIPAPDGIATMAVDDYDTLVQGYAQLAFAETEEELLLHLYDLITDYAGYTDGLDWTRPLDVLLRFFAGNPDYLTTWQGMGTATPEDKLFYKNVAAPLDALRLAVLLHQQGRSLEEIFRYVHSGKADIVGAALGAGTYPTWMAAQRLDDRTHLSPPDPQENDFGREFYLGAAQLGWLTLPKISENQRIPSQGGFLDGRYYRQADAKIASKVFLVTSFTDALNASYNAQPMELISAKLIQALLAYGDVLFINRFRQGQSVNVMDEFYYNCAEPDLRWAVKKGGILMEDAVRWLKWQGYEEVYGVGISRGATALIAAAEDVPFEQLFLMNPWRGKDTEGLSKQEQLKPQCGGGNFMNVMEGFVRHTKAKAIHAVSHDDLLAYLAANNWLERYKALFNTHISYMPPRWMRQWLYDTTYPQKWVKTIEQKLEPQQ